MISPKLADVLGATRTFKLCMNSNCIQGLHTHSAQAKTRCQREQAMSGVRTLGTSASAADEGPFCTLRLFFSGRRGTNYGTGPTSCMFTTKLPLWRHSAGFHGEKSVVDQGQPVDVSTVSWTLPDWPFILSCNRDFNAWLYAIGA